MTTLLVTGGTGTLGREVTERLRTDGHQVRVLSRRSQPYAVDLRDGTGLDAAVDGVDAIVHCATTPRGGDDTAAGHLIEAAGRAGVPHLVHVSIVGVDRVPLGYYRVKRQVELGWTILRTTQFHDLVLRFLAAAARLPVLPLPAGRGCSPSTPVKSRTGSPSWRWPVRRGGCRKWAGPRSGSSRTWPGPISGRPGNGGL